jgi:hypothetical protein
VHRSWALRGNRLQDLAADAGDGGFSCTSASSCDQGFVAGKEYFVAITIDAAASTSSAGSGGGATGTSATGGALRVRDGLPKQKDMPKEMGGSGTILPE